MAATITQPSEVTTKIPGLGYVRRYKVVMSGTVTGFTGTDTFFRNAKILSPEVGTTKTRGSLTWDATNRVVVGTGFSTDDTIYYTHIGDIYVP